MRHVADQPRDKQPTLGAVIDDRGAISRLIGAMSLEANDEWQLQKLIGDIATRLDA